MKKIALLSSLIVPFLSFAHEGHGSTDGYTMRHYFVEPDHAIFTWSFVMASFILVSYYRMKKRKSSK